MKTQWEWSGRSTNNDELELRLKTANSSSKRQRALSSLDAAAPICSKQNQASPLIRPSFPPSVSAGVEAFCPREGTAGRRAQRRPRAAAGRGTKTFKTTRQTAHVHVSNRQDGILLRTMPPKGSDTPRTERLIELVDGLGDVFVTSLASSWFIFAYFARPLSV